MGVILAQSTGTQDTLPVDSAKADMFAISLLIIQVHAKFSFGYVTTVTSWCPCGGEPV
jgi:hypothetical protein